MLDLKGSERERIHTVCCYCCFCFVLKCNCLWKTKSGRNLQRLVKARRIERQVCLQHIGQFHPKEYTTIFSWFCQKSVSFTVSQVEFPSQDCEPKPLVLIVSGLNPYANLTLQSGSNPLINSWENTVLWPTPSIIFILFCLFWCLYCDLHCFSRSASQRVPASW